MEVRNNKQLGEMGERVAIGELAKYGIDVLLPMSDNLPFDFVLEEQEHNQTQFHKSLPVVSSLC